VARMLAPLKTHPRGGVNRRQSGLPWPESLPGELGGILRRRLEGCPIGRDVQVGLARLCRVFISHVGDIEHHAGAKVALHPDAVGVHVWKTDVLGDGV